MESFNICYTDKIKFSFTKFLINSKRKLLKVSPRMKTFQNHYLRNLYLYKRQLQYLQTIMNVHAKGCIKKIVKGTWVSKKILCAALCALRHDYLSQPF